VYAVLQCVAVCCSVLQCVAVCCSVLQCVAVCCSVYRVRDVQYDTSIVCSVAVCCSVLQCVAIRHLSIVYAIRHLYCMQGHLQFSFNKLEF